LRNEPVEAGPPSAAYRFRKLAQRNKLAFAAAGAVAASLVIGLGFSTFSFLQAKKNLVRAVAAERAQESLRSEAEKLAEKNRRIAEESRGRLIRLQTDEGLRLVERGDMGGSLPFLAEAAKLRQQDSNHADAALFRLRAALNQWPTLARMLVHPGAVSQAQFSVGGSRLLTLCPGHEARVWDMTTGNPLTPGSTNFADVSCACLSPDGHRFAVGSKNDTVWQVDADSGLAIGVGIKMGPEKSSYGAEHLIFSPDGTCLLTCRSEYGRQGVNRWGEARIWDASTGQPLTPPMTHTNVLYGACWSPDGQRVATTGEDEIGCIWDAKSGARLAVFTNGGRMYHVVFSPDSRRVASGGWVKDSKGRMSLGGARIWDAATGRAITPLLKHDAGVLDVQFSPDGRRLVSAGMDRAARVWDSSTGEPLTPFFSHDDTINSTRFSPDGRMIATASDDGTARLWEAATGRMLASLRHGNAVAGAEFSPDGTLLATTSEDHFARIWNLASLQNCPLELRHRGYLLTASFSPDGARVATSADGGIVRVWDATQGTCLLTLSNRLRLSFTEAAVFSPDGRSVAAAEGIYDLGTGRQMVTFPEGYHHVQFSPSGQKFLLSDLGLTGSETRVFDAATGKPITPPLAEGRASVIHYATFSPNGKLVATAQHDGYAQVYDAATGQAVGPELRSERGVLYVAFSPDSATLASCSWDNTVRLWDISTGRERTPPLRHLAQTMGAAFSPDGLRVATASWDNTARIWDVATGHPITPPLRHRFRVEQVVFSPDSRYVLTGSGLNQNTENSGGYNGEACLWDAASGELAAPPFKCESWVRSISFSPDGRRILVADMSGTARIWTLPANDKPAEDLFSMAQILSGQGLDAAAGPEPMEAANLDASFQKMRAKYPDEFAFTLKENESWREQQAAASEWDGDWYAARFHLDRLIEAQPDDSSLRARRAHAQSELDKLARLPGAGQTISFATNMVLTFGKADNANDSGTAGNQVCEAIVFDDVPLTVAVQQLALQSGVKIVYDPSLLDQVVPRAAAKWRKVTARQALQALIDGYGWEMAEIPGSSIFRISARDQNGSDSTWAKVNLTENPPANSAAADQMVDRVVFDTVPLRNAIEALSLQAGLNIQFDPLLADKLNTTVSETWKNLTARQALQLLLDKRGLQITQIPGNPILRIAARTP
jgi:WD40 repeat protein